MNYADNGERLTYEEAMALIALAKRIDSKYKIFEDIWLMDFRCLICNEIVLGDRIDNPEIYKHGRRHISEFNLAVFI